MKPSKNGVLANNCQCQTSFRASVKVVWRWSWGKGWRKEEASNRSGRLLLVRGRETIDSDTFARRAEVRHRGARPLGDLRLLLCGKVPPTILKEYCDLVLFPLLYYVVLAYLSVYFFILN